MSWFSVKTVLFDLRLIKCNTKFVFFCLFLLYFFVIVRYLSLKKKRFLKKEKCSTFSMFGPMVFRECHVEITWKKKVQKAPSGVPFAI